MSYRKMIIVRIESATAFSRMEGGRVGFYVCWQDTETKEYRQSAEALETFEEAQRAVEHLKTEHPHYKTWIEYSSKNNTVNPVKPA